MGRGQFKSNRHHEEMPRAPRLQTAIRAGDTAPAKRPALALGVILSAQLLVVLNLSIVHVALPSIQGELDISPRGTQWLLTAYGMTFGGLLIVGGRAGVLLGRRRLFLAGLMIFSLATAAFLVSMAGGRSSAKPPSRSMAGGRDADSASCRSVGTT